MNNELLLIASVIVIYGGTLVFFKAFKLQGLYSWTVIATICANIEVLILIRAFGMEQTLGNVMFASSFLITDIVSEIYGKREANRAVNIGILTSMVDVYTFAKRQCNGAYKSYIFQHAETYDSQLPGVCRFAEIGCLVVS